MCWIEMAFIPPEAPYILLRSLLAFAHGIDKCCIDEVFSLSDHSVRRISLDDDLEWLPEPVSLPKADDRLQFKATPLQ